MGLFKTISTVAVVAGISYAAYEYVIKPLLSKFSFSGAGYGFPSFQSGKIILPVNIRFNNNSGIPVNLDRVVAEVFIWKNSAYEQVAYISQPLTIPTGSTVQTITAALDPAKIFGNLLDTITNALKNKSVAVRTILTVTYAGIELPSRTIDDQIVLPI